MELRDTVKLDKPRRTADGYLVADARVARTGVQDYLGSEVGRPEMPIVRVYRPESTVFDADTLRSFAYRPMTNSHPGKMVTSDNWREVAIGQTGGDVVRDGEFVRVPMVMMDATAIKAYESGKRELSMGYTAELVWDAGTTPSGEAYDAIQTNIRMNHLALVDRARGGKELKIGDDTHPKTRKPNMEITTRTVLVDGLSVVTTDAGAQAIEKLQSQIRDGMKVLTDAQAAHAAALAVKDAEIAKRDAEVDALKAKVLDDAAIDVRVRARSDLIAAARMVHDADYTGKSDAEIRRAAVTAKIGDAAIKDKPEAYVQARFDILAEDAAKSPVHKVLSSGATRSNVADNGYGDYVKSLNAGSTFGQPTNAGGVQ